MKSNNRSEKPLFSSLNRKLHSASKHIDPKYKDQQNEDEELNTITNEFEKQQQQFQVVMKSLYDHLHHIKHSPQSLLNIGNSFLSFYKEEDDVYNYVLQFRSACKLKQQTEDEYCAAYEILYSNANSCVMQYLELKERKKKLKNRKLDWELAIHRVEETKKKKNPKGLNDLIEKEELACLTYNELRNEIVRDMCLMMNMVVKYRTIIFKAVVECELKRRDGVNEALGMIKRFGGEDGATPLYVITRDEDSFIHENKCKKMHDKLKRNGEKYVVIRHTNDKVETAPITITPRSSLPMQSSTNKPQQSAPTQQKTIPSKSLPTTPSEPSLVSQEMQLKNDIINNLKNELFAEEKKKEEKKEEKKEVVVEKKEEKKEIKEEKVEKKEVVIETPKEEKKIEKKEETNPFADEPIVEKKEEVVQEEKKEIVEEKKEETNPFIEEPKEVKEVNEIKEIKEEEKKEETNPFVEEPKPKEEEVVVEKKEEIQPVEEVKEIEKPKEVEEAQQPIEEKKEEIQEQPKEEEIKEVKEIKEEQKEEVKQPEQQQVVVEEEKEKEKSSTSSYDNDDKEREEAKQKEEEQPIEMKMPEKPILKVKALYDYEATDDTELSLREGDIIDIYDNSGDWWMAELNGKRGLIPANFIDFIQ